MKKTIILFCILCICTPALQAQHLNVLISDKNKPEEPSICINPKNPDIIMAGANIDNYFISTDGGYTWNINRLNSTYGVWGDPCIIVDNKENFYFFHLSNLQVEGIWIDRIVCQKTASNEINWSDGSFMGLNNTKAQDKEWAVVDFENNNIYCTWTQFDDYGSTNPEHKSNILFSKSVDDGQSWSAAIQINQFSGDCIDDDNTAEGAVPAIGPNGEIYVAWANAEKLYFDKSTDVGENWLENDIVIGEQPNGWAFEIPGIMRCNGLPITCCDTSNSTYRGTIYVNWSDQRNGIDNTDIWVSKSTDGGVTWSEAIKINNDETNKHQFFTWMTIDQSNGYIYCVFYDRRAYSDKQTDVYIAVSRNGGESFENYKISESPFIPNAAVFFGDYTNISVHNNRIRPIWTRLDEIVLSVWTAIVEPDLLELSEQQVIFAPTELVYPNPTTALNYYSFKLKRSALVNLYLFDIFGNRITSIYENETLNTGKYIEQINFDALGLKSGIYFYSFSKNNDRKITKVIYIE